MAEPEQKTQTSNNVSRIQEQRLKTAENAPETENGAIPQGVPSRVPSGVPSGGPSGVPQKAAKPLSPNQIEKAKKKRQLILRGAMNKVKEYSAKLREKFGKYVKAVVVFGSFARGNYTIGSDIDVLVIIDDTESDKPIDQPLRDSLHNQMQDLGVKIDKEIHIQLHTLTEFWDYIRNGDPLFFNYLRSGIPVYDGGFYKPMNRLLVSGAIKPSQEAIFKSIDGAKSYLTKVVDYMNWAIERMFRAATWSANAFLMASGMPPAEVPELAPVFRKYFVEPGTMPPEYPDILEEIVKLQKGIEHGEIKNMTPEKVAEVKKKCDNFLAYMEKNVNELMKGKKRADDLKEKIKTTPKVFWTYGKEDRRGYSWLFEKSIYVAVYLGKNIDTVLVSHINEGKLGPFNKTESKNLFASLETNQFKPIVTTGLIQLIFKSMPPELLAGIDRAGVEFPGRALVDLTNVTLAPPVGGSQGVPQGGPP
ncbi:MAG: nucleotidyltransferase domain-containing protein [archaeon]